MGHEFTTLNSVITIPTACELCSSFTWLKEKGLVCSTCKLTCHKKCYTKIKTGCDATGVKKKVRGGGGGGGGSGEPVGELITLAASTGILFGVYLDKLGQFTTSPSYFNVKIFKNIQKSRKILKNVEIWCKLRPQDSFTTRIIQKITIQS